MFTCITQSQHFGGLTQQKSVSLSSPNPTWITKSRIHGGDHVLPIYWGHSFHLVVPCLPSTSSRWVVCVWSKFKRRGRAKKNVWGMLGLSCSVRHTFCVHSTGQNSALLTSWEAERYNLRKKIKFSSSKWEKGMEEIMSEVPKITFRFIDLLGGLTRLSI